MQDPSAKLHLWKLYNWINIYFNSLSAPNTWSVLIADLNCCCSRGLFPLECMCPWTRTFVRLHFTRADSWFCKLLHHAKGSWRTWRSLAFHEELGAEGEPDAQSVPRSVCTTRHSPPETSSVARAGASAAWSSVVTALVRCNFHTAEPTHSEHAAPWWAHFQSCTTSATT